jgi:hypothetical protein
MTVDYNSVVWAYGMEDIFVSGGNRYLRDSGPNGFSMRFLGGAADPTPTLTGELSFDGGDYLYYDGDLTRYYNKMPTGALTFLCVTNQTTAATRVIFACELSGANNFGLRFAAATAAIYECYQMQGAAAAPAVQPTGYSITRPHLTALTIETTPRLLLNQQIGTAAWAGGAFGTCVYNTAVVPRIGSAPGGGAFWLGTMKYLALIRGAVSSPDLSQLSALLANGVKPFCVRR